MLSVPFKRVHGFKKVCNLIQLNCVSFRLYQGKYFWWYIRLKCGTYILKNKIIIASGKAHLSKQSWKYVY